MSRAARVPLPPGTPSAVGSLPHVDPQEAAALALSSQPELPAAPQLPRRSRLEGMVAQVAWGMAGVEIDPGGGLAVAVARLGPGPGGAPLDPEAWSGALAFLEAAGREGRTGPVKLQLAGPVTLARALVRAGAPAGRAVPAAVATVVDRVLALKRAAAGALPEAGLVVVLDEPALAGAGHDMAGGWVDGALASVLSAVRPAVAGIHCCGPVPWPTVLGAAPDLVSAPVECLRRHDAARVAAFLDGGGWLAWGVVPTDRPMEASDQPGRRRLATRWRQLAEAGCDPARLRAQAVFTPACGLAGHDPASVGAVYARVRRLAHRAMGAPGPVPGGG